MDLSSIVVAFQHNSPLVPRAVRVLFNYSHPLSEREASQLSDLARRQHEAREAGLQPEEPSDEARRLMDRPLHPLSPLAVLQCVLGAARIPSFPPAQHRRLQCELLPRVAGAAPLSLEEWAHILQSVAALPMGSSMAALRCAEEALRAALPAVFGTAAARAVGQDDPGQQRAAKFTREDVQAQCLRVLAAVVARYATRHAASAKHSALPGTFAIPRGNECFLESRPLRRLRRAVATATAASESVWPAALSKLSETDAVTLRIALFQPDVFAGTVTKDALLQVIKGSPALLLRLLGKRPVPGSLRVDHTVPSAAADILQVCGYNMGLTHCTLDAARDYVAVMLALPVEAKAEYFKSRGKDGFVQLFMPFVNHTKVLTYQVARDWQDLYGILIQQAVGIPASADPCAVDGDVLASFVEAASDLVVGRCRAGPEKAAVMTLTAAALRAVQKSPSDVEGTPQVPMPVAPLARMLERELASPSTESAHAAWRLLRVSGVESAVVDAMRAALSEVKNSKALRRSMLLHISPQRAPEDVLTGLVDPLFDMCEEVEVDRPDAFLALRIAVARGIPPRHCALLSRADVLAQLGDGEDEVEGLAETAIALSRIEMHAPYVLLLTHSSGLLRKRLIAHVAQIAVDDHAILAMWDSVTRLVFGLNAPERPAILSAHVGAAVPLLVAVGSALLKHTSKTVVDIALYELLLCCGHDHVQGEDPYYYQTHAQLLGRHRTSSAVVCRRTLTRLFGAEHKALLSMHGENIAEKLCAAFNGPVHVGTASSRGYVLLLSSVSPSASQKAVDRLLRSVSESITYMTSLDARDRAIAADSPLALLEYEDLTLREQHLLKTYSDRPPKGMTEDDYEALKRKDALALAKGREALRRELESRKHVIAETVRQRKTSLATVRTLGTTGRFNLEAVAALYPPLQDALNRRELPKGLEQHVVDATAGLLARTVFGPMAENMVCTVARLQGETSLTVADVSQISTMAMQLRQALIQMIDVPLFVVLLPFSRVAFKAGRGGNAVQTTIPVSTQHQIMGLLIQNIGQAHLPQPTETLRLLNTILQSFPSLFKSVQQGTNLLMAMIPTSHMPTLESGFFNDSDSVKEVTAAAFHRFSHFSVCRRALVLAAIFLHDTSMDVIKAMQLVMTTESAAGFALDSCDWTDLVYFLETYGQKQKTHATRVGETMKELFVLPTTTEAQQRIWLQGVQKVSGLAAVIAVQVLSPSLKGEAYHDALLFLCAIAELPTTEPFMRLVLACGRRVLNDCDIDILKAIAPMLQSSLGKPPKDLTPTHKELYLATSTVWLTIISCRLKETSLLESIIEQQSSTLNNSNSAMVHRAVCDSMIEITKNEDVRNSPKLDEFVEKCLKQAIHSGSYIKKKAHAYGLVGVLQGLGLTSLRRYKIPDTMQTAVREKQAERSGVMVLLEVLTEVMGAKFEPYALALTGALLEGVADKDQKVSECADDAARVMARSLTAVGLHQLIPRIVEGLSSEHAKNRVPPLNFIGYVAFCSPKQLAATLPEITKHINACLFDVNHNVSSAAMSALRRVAGVVSNAEIREHVEVVLGALRSPSTETENALDALLYTRFVNAVDPASLALIVPIVARGLSAQMPHTRPKAAQIVASMVTLVNDPKSLKPYAKDLVKLLEESAQDPHPETRTTSAKALASLSAAIGGHIVDDIVAWCFALLQKPHWNSIEKAGAAQVFVELVASCGDAILIESLATIRNGMSDERPPVKEGFLYIMVYSPSTFSPLTFQGFLPEAFPWVLEGLSHFSERVRDVALSAGTGIITFYGTRNLSFILTPLLDGVVSEITTLRQSSMLLASKLLIHMVQQIRKKMRIQAARDSVAGDSERAEELAHLLQQEADVDDLNSLNPNGSGSAAGTGTGGETGALEVEMARNVEKRGVSILGSLEDMLGTESFVRLFSAMYCGRHEHSLSVRTDTNAAWQACVASLRGAVSKIFDGLIDVLIFFSSSDNSDCVDMAIKTIEFTSRLNETIERFVDSLCDRYKKDNRRSKLGALTCLSHVVSYVDNKRLIGMGGQIVGCVMPGMQEKDERVQAAAREVFAKVTKSIGSRLIENAVEAQIDTSVRGVVEVVKVKPSVALALVFKHLKQKTTYTVANVELLDAILDVEEADEDMQRYVDDVGRIILTFLVQRLDGAYETYIKFIENLPIELEYMPREQWQHALRVPSTRCGALLAAKAYGIGVSIDCVDGLTAVFRAAIEALGGDDNDEDNEARLVAVSMIPELILSIEERVVEELEEEEQQDTTMSKRASSRYLLQFLDVFLELSTTARSVVTAEEPEFTVLSAGEPRLFEALMAFYNRGLDYGTPMQKVQAVECIQDLLTFAPRDVRAGAANLVAGRCSKVLFTCNEGQVVHALVNLCLMIMDYPASGKEKMVEGTMALAMFNAALCDSGEARVLALRVVIQLLRRSEKYADLILGTVVTKKNAVDTPLLRGVMCRFISVVIRYGNLSKALGHVTKLMDIVLPLWDRAETPATAAMAGVAVAALCKSASIAEEQVAELQGRALDMMRSKGTGALGGFAFTYSLLTCSAERACAGFARDAAIALQAAAALGASDKPTVTWMLRAAAAVIDSGSVSAAEARAEVFTPILRRVDAADEVMLSTAQYFYDVLVKKCPTAVRAVEELPRERSAQWAVLEHFNAILDDEAVADNAY